jgi:hypothetical protein
MRFVPVLALLALSTPAVAQDSGAKVDKNSPDRVICKRIQATGTILGAKKECRTKAEWNIVEERARLNREGAGEY